jgi:hypothetical protein
MFRRSNKVTETNIATATSNNCSNNNNNNINNNSQHNRTISTSTSTSSNSHVLNTTSNLYHRCWNLILSYSSSSIIIVGLLVYGVLFQLLIIRSKDETIATLTQQYTKMNNLQHRFASFRNDCSQANTSGATTNNATRSTSTNNTGNIISHGVGVFPIRKPIIDNSTIPKTIPIWKPFSTTVLSKVSYPIFVTSLPKSGTTSIWKYFKCGHQLSCHNWIQKIDDTKSSIAGICIEDNILHHRPPFENCGRYDVYTDTGVRLFVVCFRFWVGIYKILPTNCVLSVCRNSLSLISRVVPSRCLYFVSVVSST